ncbi:uncharacterized protein A4U43_C01F2890 [Asparagus officinalis]|uniref:Casein kinase substrate phosphoprotein PP28 domain-containing protein n=1 Tax=Asparagus officinalis TaxID=4686 RepID=A0A5P1FL98_ASPOF|nr:uncharacterized protein A4U43_C01F2890 [Asparagus officinalis]
MVRGSNNQQFKDKAKNRVADLEGMFTDLQSARLEEQVHQLLREWKAELCEASPGNSLIGDCKGDSDLSSEIWRLLHIGEEEDDATSKLEEIVAVNSKAEPAESGHENGLGGFQGEEVTVFEQEHFVNQELSKHGFLNIDEYKSTPPTGSHHAVSSCSEKTNGLSYEQFNLHEEVQRSHYINNFEGTLQNGGNIPHHQELSHISEWLPAISPPASAFLNPKCALWDCPRPAEGKRWCQDYCCSGHASLALSEGLPGMNPVLRPGGIDLKDGPLFAALAAKTQGKIVGIPECEGAATTKSPWNAPATGTSTRPRTFKKEEVEDREEEESEEESAEESEEENEKRKGTEGLIEIENPNLVKPKSVKAKDANFEKTTELSRREREEIEKQRAHERYMRLQEQGKTEQARKDLERLALVRQQRAEAAKKREEEKAAKETKKAEARK